jgi:hypothetical protein
MATTFKPAPAFTVEDPNRLAKTDLTQCELMMNISHHQLIYTLFDPEDQTFIALKGYYFDSSGSTHALLEVIEQCLDQDKILFTAFHKTRIAFDSPHFTLVPSSLYNPGLKKNFFSFLYPGQPGQALLHDQIDALKAVNLYAMDKNVTGYLKKEFRHARYYHSETAFLTGLLAHEPLKDTRAYIRVVSGCMVLTVLEQDRVLLMQPYAIHQSMDALYHIVNALTQLNISPGELQVRISGEIEEDSPLYRELSYELPALSWLKHPPSYHYVSGFEQYADHHFYNLLSLASCE